MFDKRYGSLAYQYKRQMNDIVFYAYKGSPKLREYQDFRIECHSKELKSKLGDCRHLNDGSSLIRIFYAETENWENILVTLIHEISHHIDFKKRGYSGHDDEFYLIHKKLLVTALDMEIVTFDAIQKFWNSKARNARKIASLMSDYIPHPIPYKKDTCTVYVYNSFSIKDILKQRGYRWNESDQSWYKELEKIDINSERNLLLTLGMTEDNIAITELKGVINRRQPKVVLYGVEYENKDEVKALGYRWDSERKVWYKKISAEDISDDEKEKIKAIGKIRITIVR